MTPDSDTASRRNLLKWSSVLADAAGAGLGHGQCSASGPARDSASHPARGRRAAQGHVRRHAGERIVHDFRTGRAWSACVSLRL
jgi:hypothetical protein